MNRTQFAVERMLDSLDAQAYDLGVLSERGMLPALANLAASDVKARIPLLMAHNARGAHIYIRPAGEHRYTVLDDLSAEAVERLSADGYEPCAVVETSTGNFQAWLKHEEVYPAAVSTLAAQTLASRYGADPNAADWRRFGRLPGFTNCKPKYRKENGLFPYVLLRTCSGVVFSNAARLRFEITKLYQLDEQERESRAVQYQTRPTPATGQPAYSCLSLERFRDAAKFHDRPAAADIAFCVAAISLRMPDEAIAAALETNYLSSDPNPSRRAAYIRRTMTKARSWVRR
ncbi:MAG: RepB family DNA primase [Terracidiphilus sp.]|jgi:hypothetical protein